MKYKDFDFPDALQIIEYYEDEIVDLCAELNVRVPEDYLSLVKDGGIDCGYELEGYVRWIRIWGVKEGLNANSSWEFQKFLPGCYSFGDDQGSNALVFMEGLSGEGVYLVPFSAKDLQNALYLCSTMMELLQNRDMFKKIFL